MQIFSACCSFNTNLTNEAIILRLPNMVNANRRFGFYFKYLPAEGRHWLVPEYLMYSRGLPITIELVMEGKPGQVQMILNFEIPSYIKALLVFAAISFASLFITFLIINPKQITTTEWLMLLMPFIASALLWFQFSSQVSYYLKAFKEAWAFAEREAE